MKIFSAPENTAIATEPKKMGRARLKHVASEKMPISEQEIREKLAAHVETSNTAKSITLQKNSKQLGAGFMNEDMKPAPIVAEKPKANEQASVDEEAGPKSSVKDSHLLLSDVKLNDPKDPETQEKLKSVLSKGAFNFNPREKEALEKILGAQ